MCSGPGADASSVDSCSFKLSWVPLLLPLPPVFQICSVEPLQFAYRSHISLPACLLPLPPSPPHPLTHPQTQQHHTKQDVLLTILECFPAKQAAVPLRAVCRAWRDLFNSSVHCITIHSNLQLLPQNPSRFPNLRHLCISQTNSTAAKAAVRMLGVPNCATLTMLEISNTWMLEPPLDLHKLTALKTLSITNCKMKSVMSAQLHVLPHLQALDLSSNNLEGMRLFLGGKGQTVPGCCMISTCSAAASSSREVAIIPFAVLSPVVLMGSGQRRVPAREAVQANTRRRAPVPCRLPFS